jgi:hypothetical protein
MHNLGIDFSGRKHYFHYIQLEVGKKRASSIYAFLLRGHGCSG